MFVPFVSPNMSTLLFSILSSWTKKAPTAGAMLEEPLAEGAAPKMSGSCMLIGAKTREEVIERLKRDKYVSNEVWDWEKVQIIPFKSALRKPL